LVLAFVRFTFYIFDYFVVRVHVLD